MSMNFWIFQLSYKSSCAAFTRGVKVDWRFLTSQLFGETEHLSFDSQFNDEAGVGPSAAPNILPSWLRWKNFNVEFLLKCLHSCCSRNTRKGGKKGENQKPNKETLSGGCQHENG